MLAAGLLTRPVAALAFGIGKAREVGKDHYVERVVWMG